MRKLLIVLPLVAGLHTIALADAGDPPSRVARLNFQSGNVSFRPAGMDKWSAAVINDPLISGDYLWTAAGARAELHIGSAAIRMGSETSLAILNLTDTAVQLSVSQGSVHIRVRRLDDRESFEVDTPNAAVTLLRPGEYRVDGNPDAETTLLSVRSGDAEVTPSGAAAFPLHARQSARLAGTDRPGSELLGVAPPDEWDRWCEARDQREERAASTRYVSREVIGYEDLDEYGVWREVPPYGPVWVPARVEPGWAPYRYGHWRWVEPWGWTWVDAAPWGFAPFHYGRWVYAGGGWAWVPGRVVARPVYAPALVAFVGGPHFSLSVAVGGGSGVAWFPLGPGEVYRPAYRVSPTYVREVNVTHVTNITNVTNVTEVRNVTYVNQRVSGATTVVRQDVFAGAQPVHRSVVRVNERDISRAEVVTAAPIAPRAESMIVRPAEGPPQRVIARRVVVKSEPAAAPVPFAARQQALQANPGRPVDAGTMETLRSRAPAQQPAFRRADMPARAPQQGGWRRFESAPAQQPSAAPSPAAPRGVERPRNNERPAAQDSPAPRPRGVDRPAASPADSAPARVAPADRRPERVRPDRPAPTPAAAPAATPSTDRPAERPRRPEQPEMRREQKPDRPAEVRREQKTERQPERRTERKQEDRKAEDRKPEKRDERRKPEPAQP